MSDIRDDFDMRAPLGARARGGPTVRAAMDPGYEIGVVIARGDEAPLEIVGAPHVVSVGRWRVFDPPQTRTNRAGKTYVVKRERIVDVEDRDEAARKVLALLVSNGVTHLVIENVEDPYFGKDVTAGKAARVAKDLGKSGKIAEAVRLWAMVHGIEVTLTKAATWRARLRPLIEAARVVEPTPDPTDEPTADDTEAEADPGRVTGRGLQLVPVLRVGIVGWPVGGPECNEHTRDAGGMVLWSVLPAVDRRRAKATGRTRGPKRPPGTPRVATTEKWYVTALEKRRNARIKAGCQCTPGNSHKLGCPVYKRKPRKARVVPADPCACSTRCSWFGPECPGRRAARRAKIKA